MDPREALDDPVLNSDEFDEIVDLLLCHGLQKDRSDLLSKIIEKLPDFDEKFCSPHRQVLILLAYCYKFQQNGPLPDISHHKFLHTLHDSLVGLLKSEARLTDLMSRIDTYKLVGGIRALLARAVLLQPKFTPKDIEITIANYFPTLPVKPSNSKPWENWAEILKLDLEDNCDVLKEVNRVNGISAKHLTVKLNNLAVERRKTSQDGSIIIIWNTVAPKFDEFVRHLKSLLPENFLENIATNSHPKMKIISSKIQPNASEAEVIQFFDYLCDIFMESKFWTSNFVLEKLSNVQR